jgi:hypothetical protein
MFLSHKTHFLPSLILSLFFQCIQHLNILNEHIEFNKKKIIYIFLKKKKLLMIERCFVIFFLFFFVSSNEEWNKPKKERERKINWKLNIFQFLLLFFFCFINFLITLHRFNCCGWCLLRMRCKYMFYTLVSLSTIYLVILTRMFINKFQ